MNSGLSSVTASIPFGLGLTVGAFVLAQHAQRRFGNSPFLQPVLLASIVLAIFLAFAKIPIEHYQQGANLVHHLLGPATVALAVPLYREVGRIREALLPVLGSILIGSVTAAGSAVAIAHFLGASRLTLLSIAPKSVSTPIAIGVSEAIGGDSGRAVLCVVFTGILGAVTGAGCFRLLGIRDARAIGIGMGVSAHGIGTSRALQMGRTQGAFSGLAMGLTGFVTAVLLPVFVRLFG
jgi:predicted murein hydrolase (TIGR00659 family)